ncbi:NUDIX domain-containing protein [Candidatus Woesearchaeota archaeon]|nr:NUDIX domain-containing protein [Candidatus Woesearchaeota archaeon]
MKEEYLDIVDEEDNVVRQATWKEMMDRKLLHRTANVFVLNSKGELFVHRRAEHLRLYPGLWDVKVGGSVRAGESYEDAGKREVMEETGATNVKLTEIFRIKYRKPEHNVNRCVFKCVYDGKIKIDETEVAEGKFTSIDDAKKMMADGKLSPSATDVFMRFLRQNKNDQNPENLRKN